MLHFLISDGVSPALVLADYPSASLSTEDPAVTAPSSIPLQERVIQQAASQGASGAAVGGQSQLVSSQGSTGVKIRCKMCRCVSSFGHIELHSRPTWF